VDNNNFSFNGRSSSCNLAAAAKPIGLGKHLPLLLFAAHSNGSQWSQTIGLARCFMETAGRVFQATATCCIFLISIKVPIPIRWQGGQLRFELAALLAAASLRRFRPARLAQAATDCLWRLFLSAPL